MHSEYEAAAHRKALRRARAPGATSKALHEERLLEKAAEYQESGRSSVRFCHPNKWSPDSQCLRRVDTYLFPNGFSGVEARCCHHCLSPFQQTATSLTPLASFQARKTFRLALTKIAWHTSHSISSQSTKAIRNGCRRAQVSAAHVPHKS